MDLRTWCPILQRETSATELCQVSFGRIVRCDESKLIRYFPARSSEELAAVHATPEYFQHPYFEARRNLSRTSVLQKHCALLRTVADGDELQGKRMLDIGCDTGTLLLAARDDFGMETEGVEVSEAAASVARQQYGLTVHLGLLHELKLPEMCYDLITLVDVIEHVSDPASLLAQLYLLLKPGGKCYISTADHDALINHVGLALYRLLGKQSWSVLEKLYIPYHEYYFTQNTLTQLVRQAGFVVQRHYKTEFPLDEFGHGIIYKLGLLPLMTLQRLLNRQTLQNLVAVKPAKDDIQ